MILGGGQLVEGLTASGVGELPEVVLTPAEVPGTEGDVAEVFGAALPQLGEIALFFLWVEGLAEGRPGAEGACVVAGAVAAGWDEGGGFCASGTG